MSEPRIVIVGASLAGATAAATLRPTASTVRSGSSAPKASSRTTARHCRRAIFLKRNGSRIS